ncbi:MAG TPA: hypothetical protein VK466_12535 [Terriglobales bacterium]|nr:hypothetical protein [Terriglobales bacterium]
MTKVFLACAALLSTTMALGQGKISSQWNCAAKTDVEHALEVGDHPGHSYWIGQGKCASAKGEVEGVKEQEGTWTQFNDVTGSKYSNHGIFIVTMANGDKVTYNYHGTADSKDGKLESGANKWSIVGGTGKFQNIKGEGSCKGKGSPDGSGIWDCEGTYMTK